MTIKPFTTKSQSPREIFRISGYQGIRIWGLGDWGIRDKTQSSNPPVSKSQSPNPLIPLSFSVNSVSLCLCGILFFCGSALAQSDYTYNEEGLKYLQSKDYERAIASLKTAHRLNPTNAAIRHNLAVAYNEYGLALADDNKFKESVLALREAQRFDSASPVIKKNISNIFVAQARQEVEKNNLRQAINIFQEAINEDENNWVAYVEMGEAYYISGEIKYAISSWEKALQINRDIEGLSLKLEKARKEEKIEEKFRQKESLNFKIKYEGYERLDLAYQVINILREAYRNVGFNFHSYPDGPWTVIIYTSEQFRQVTSSPDWSGGIYDGKIRIREGDILNDEKMLRKVLYHEYTHALIFYLTKGNCPTWLNEGLAQAEEPGNEWTQPKAQILRNAKKEAGFISIFNLYKPFLTYTDPRQVALAYAESESFVRYLLERFSRYRVNKVLELLGSGKSIEESVKEGLYKDLLRLESDWYEKI